MIKALFFQDANLLLVFNMASSMLATLIGSLSTSKTMIYFQLEVEPFLSCIVIIFWRLPILVNHFSVLVLVQDKLLVYINFYVDGHTLVPEYLPQQMTIPLLYCSLVFVIPTMIACTYPDDNCLSVFTFKGSTRVINMLPCIHTNIHTTTHYCMLSYTYRSSTAPNTTACDRNILQQHTTDSDTHTNIHTVYRHTILFGGGI